MAIENVQPLLERIQELIDWFNPIGVQITYALKGGVGQVTLGLDVSINADNYDPQYTTVIEGLSPASALDSLERLKIKLTQEMDDGTADEVTADEKNRLNNLAAVTPADLGTVSWQILNTDNTSVKLPDPKKNLNLFMDLVKRNMVIGLQSQFSVLGFEVPSMHHIMPWNYEANGFSTRLYDLVGFLRAMGVDSAQLDAYWAVEQDRI